MNNKSILGAYKINTMFIGISKFLLATNLSTQIIKILCQKTQVRECYDGNSLDICYSVQQIIYGGYIIAGQFTVSQQSWDGKDNVGNRLPDGVYFISLTSENFSAIEKIIKLK